jgi:hypothetical protein
MNNIRYIGNGAYCYANSTSMLLASIGEDISPSLIEVLTGVSVGATLKKDKNLLYFNNQTLLPDLGLTKALEILGFQYQTKVFNTPEDFPVDEFAQDLKTSPAVIGPLDMSLLVYNPNHKYLKGADHFVLAYELKDKNLHLHDPAGFPHVYLNLENLKLAWQAQNVSYRKGYYRYTFSPKRIETPSKDEIYSRALAFFKQIYKEGEERADKSVFAIGKDAIEEFAKYTNENGLNEKEFGHFVYFALPLGAKRALDFSTFLKPYNSKISGLKRDQAVVFGECHTLTVMKDWKRLSESLWKLAEIEDQFMKIVMEEK